jgi:hypothetical protein
LLSETWHKKPDSSQIFVVGSVHSLSSLACPERGIVAV